MSERAEQMAQGIVAAALARRGISKAAGGDSAALALDIARPLCGALVEYGEYTREATRRARKVTKRIKANQKVLDAIASPAPVPHGQMPYKAGQWKTVLAPVTPPVPMNGHAHHQETDDEASQWS